jgi:hypothetical protein
MMRGIHIPCMILVLCTCSFSAISQGLQSEQVTLSSDSTRTFKIANTSLLRKPVKSALIQQPESILLLKSPCLEMQPFFCRIESRIEQKSGIALRFRLGSLDYTNYLEGKGADER